MITCWMGDLATLDPDTVEPGMWLKKSLLPNFATKELEKAFFSDIAQKKRLMSLEEPISAFSK